MSERLDPSLVRRGRFYLVNYRGEDRECKVIRCSKAPLYNKGKKQPGFRRIFTIKLFGEKGYAKVGEHSFVKELESEES